MAVLDDLIAQVSDPTLRKRLQAEVARANKQKKFGLVFEEHLPECTPLYEVPVKEGRLVARQTDVGNVYIVESITDDMAVCISRATKEREDIPVADLVAVAEFGDPIYPYLEPIDKVENAPDSDLWHTLIEADNYHALQLLLYLYAKQVSCIYIDPPYNTGAKDWKYNNNYVDATDQYRHSKWLSFMEKRLKLAKKLLNPKDSVLIVTIDEKEYNHLGCLLEELFPEATIQMISITINPSGAVRKGMFAKADEYAYFVLFGDAQVTQPKGNGEETEVRWWYLRRLEYASRRGTVKGGVAQFYPIYINNRTYKIEKIGEPIPPSVDRFSVPNIEGCTTVFPVRDDGVEMNWGVTGDTLHRLINERVIQVKKNNKSQYQPYTIKYLSENYSKKIKEGRWAVKGYREDGSKIVVETGGKIKRTTTVWTDKRYDAKTHGTVILKNIVGNDRFSFPKSIYSVHDSIMYFESKKPNALIVDFFAGSGTTLHAVNLLNAEDGGHRRCIMVTNNEVSADEEKALKKQGYKPTDAEWQRLGIARYVTWPRTVCSIEGHDVKGEPLKGTYLGSDRPMADGFAANVAFFHLGFLDKHEVARGEQLARLIPVLWMKAGAIGPCPTATEATDMMVFPRNKFAVLINTKYTYEFTQAVAEQGIEVAYIITDYEAEYRSIAQELAAPTTYQLYSDYLENFTINTRRA